MYKKLKVSLVMPAYNEEKSLKVVLKEFKNNIFDEIVVVDNNSTDKTKEVSLSYGAKVYSETNQGQGFAMKKALQKATGDLIFIIESDGTFAFSDIKYFLDLSSQYDVVLGSRTNKINLKKKTIKWYVYYGNFILSSFLKLRYNSKLKLSDVGCTFKMFNKVSLDKIKNNLKVGGSDACVEHIILSLKNKLKIKQIPVRYNKRIGETKQSFNIYSSFLIGLNHLKHIYTR